MERILEGTQPHHHFPGILLFYFLGTFVIGLLVPSNSEGLNLKSGKGTAAESPFVIAIERAGIKALPSVS
jgi:amino acid transporter